MQTMSTLLRIGGSLEMTVQLHHVTPGEAWLLMHVHDPEIKDVFEGAELSEDVERSKVDERQRLRTVYPQHLALIDHLFPGRTAGDIPDTFAELEGVPLDLASQGRQAKRKAAAREQVADAEPEAGDEFVMTSNEPAPLTPDEVREQVLGSGRRKK